MQKSQGDRARHCFAIIPVVGWATVKKILPLITCFVIGVSGLTACYVYARLNTSGPPLAAPARLFVAPGSTLQQTAQMLVAEGILASVQPFRFWAQFTGKDRSIQSGEYILETPLTPLRLLETLTQGQVIHHMVTTPGRADTQTDCQKTGRPRVWPPRAIPVSEHLSSVLIHSGTSGSTDWKAICTRTPIFFQSKALLRIFWNVWSRVCLRSLPRPCSSRPRNWGSPNMKS